MPGDLKDDRRYWEASVDCDQCDARMMGHASYRGTEEDAIADAVKGWNARQEAEELTAPHQQLQQAEARVAELGRLNNNLGDALVSHIEYESQQPQMRAFILRKQAEAVRDSIDICKHMFFSGFNIIKAEDLRRYAQRLRQQADELE
jgi:hypothetical protein